MNSDIELRKSFDDMQTRINDMNKTIDLMGKI